MFSLLSKYSSRIKTVISIGLPIVLALTLSYFLQAKIITNQEEFTNWLYQFGPSIIIVYVFLQALAIIIAPVGGFFLVVAMIALFGPKTAIILSYLVVTPCYLINFFLARRYGRPFVKKIIGQEPLNKLDDIIKNSGTWILIVTRVLQGANFDYLSYAWGLTKIPFKTYLIVNFLGGIPGSLVTYFIISRFDNLVYGLTAFYTVTVVFAVMAIYATYYLKSLKKS